jgi:hypothetical protein
MTRTERLKRLASFDGLAERIQGASLDCWAVRAFAESADEREELDLIALELEALVDRILAIATPEPTAGMADQLSRLELHLRAIDDALPKWGAGRERQDTIRELVRRVEAAMPSPIAEPSAERVAEANEPPLPEDDIKW